MNLNFINRGLEWFSRFVTGLQVFGLYGAWKVFVLSNRRIKNKTRKAFSSVKIDNRFDFFFRKGIDHPAMSHFYEPGCYIQNNDGPAIKKILDAGANIGDETARFYLLYPGIEMVAIEAEKNNFEVLQKNFSSVKSVETINGAMWHESGKVKIADDVSVGESTESFSFKAGGGDNDGINAYSVADILTRKGWDKIDIFKIDIEGAEEELFSYNTKDWINRVNCFIIETHDRYKPAVTQKIFKALSGESYNTFVSGENLVFIKTGLPWEVKVIKGVMN